MKPVSSALTYDNALCLRHTPRIIPELPQVFWHHIELLLKLSCAHEY